MLFLSVWRLLFLCIANVYSIRRLTIVSVSTWASFIFATYFWLFLWLSSHKCHKMAHESTSGHYKISEINQLINQRLKCVSVSTALLNFTTKSIVPPVVYSIFKHFLTLRAILCLYLMKKVKFVSLPSLPVPLSPSTDSYSKSLIQRSNASQVRSWNAPRFRVVIGRSGFVLLLCVFWMWHCSGRSRHLCTL